MKASSLILSLCAALFVLSGCSTPCESVCASFNECTLEERDHKVDCRTFCEREQQFEETAADMCKTQFDAHISCWEANIASICTPDKTPTAEDPEATTFKCQTEATAWTDCVAKFCAVEANAMDPACVPQDEGPALPSMAGF